MPGKPKRFSKLSMCMIASLLCATGVAVGPLPAVSQQQESDKNPLSITEQPKGKAFRSPAAAAASLYAAARRNDENELLVILGPGAKDLVSWTDDPNERAEQRKIFADKYDQMHRLVKEPDDTVALYVGAENWPVPVPIVEYHGKWYFDTDLGKQEVLYRRIGRNEMEALEVCHALIDAEKDYYSGEHKYTANFLSNTGSHDGLYWNASASRDKSPIGLYLAHAGIGEANSPRPEPYYGYYYRIVLNVNSAGNRETGFAVLAVPAQYRSSGVMTFLVEEDGTEYEKDLGPNAAESVKQMSSPTPGNGWSKVE